MLSLARTAYKLPDQCRVHLRANLERRTYFFRSPSVSVAMTHGTLDLAAGAKTEQCRPRVPLLYTDLPCPVAQSVLVATVARKQITRSDVRREISTP